MFKINMKKNKLQFHKTGFTLIEMLIAVAIFSLALVALMSISSKGLKTAQRAEKQFIADYLAIEAIEVVHNLCDAALLHTFNTSSWEMVFQGSPDIINGDEGCFDGTSACNFYFQPGDSQPVLGTCSDCTVFVNESEFYYFQTQNDTNSGYQTTPYRREISIKSGSVEGQVVVEVTVFWGNKNVVYTENLYLWQ